MPVYAYALVMVFKVYFLDSDLSIHVYLLDFRVTTDSLITIYITGHCLYLRTWTASVWSCTCVTAYARQLASSYVLVGLFSDNPRPSRPDLEAQQKHGGILLWKPWTSSRSIESAIAHSWPVSLNRLTRFSFVVSEYLQILFIPCDHTLRLFDVIFMSYWITPCDTVYLYFFVGMYITTVLPYFNSCLYCA